MSEYLKQPFTIYEMAEGDVVEANEMRLQSWLDTYVNEDVGVTREWVENRNRDQMSEENMERRKRLLRDPNTAGWIAKDVSGKIVGVTTPYTDSEGVQHVGSLYVDKEWLGKGVGSQLMQKVIDYFDPEKPIVLSVVSYNERAKIFYRKWGFEEVPGSESLFADTIPEVNMIRKGEKR